MGTGLMAWVWLVWGMAAGMVVVPDESYRQGLEAWRREREEKLRGEDGWLSVCGLHWLREGVTTIGADPSCDLVLPEHAPGDLGVIALEHGLVRFRATPGVQVLVRGRLFESGVLKSDAEGDPDVLVVGDVKLLVIQRGKRLAIRVKDKRNPLRRSFAGLRWYPPREEWRKTARFVAYPAPTQLKMDTIVGETEVEDSPGYVLFEHGGREYRLEAAQLKRGGLWFVFRDGTSGRTTHPGARQLETAKPKDGLVELDFNKAVNLPCSYIPFATCPIAPPANRLKLAIEAGELKYEPGQTPRKRS